MLIRQRTVYAMMVIIILVNAIGLFQPLLRNDDPVLYAIIAKNIVLSNDWIDLIFGGKPWLDKPHFTFWITALSFKVFGINSFAYIFPGFIFHLLGAYYTYRLARLLFNHDTAIISVLIYLTSLHLIISSSVDIRAEAYLLGEIMPAAYYWLIYDRNSRLKPLILASLFTSMAMMTKGLFVVVTIFSGMVFSWIYTRQYSRIISPKWLVAYTLCLIFILPELISLYLQFDEHPTTLVSGHDHLSGISWYFWGSQFGRFFNSGPIVNTHGNPLFFVHTYLWAFLPWSLLFIIATYTGVRYFREQNKENRAKAIYLLASFWVTFIMFSATKFQLDHYTNIIMPFAAIWCANYLCANHSLLKISKMQIWLTWLMLTLNIVIVIYLFKFTIYSLIALVPIVLLVTMRKLNFTALEKSIIFPTSSMIGIMLLIFTTNQVAYAPYDIGYNLAKRINEKPILPIYVLGLSSLTLEFYAKGDYLRAESSGDLPDKGNYYVALSEEDWRSNRYKLDQKQFAAANSVCGNTIDKIIPNYANTNKLKLNLKCYKVIKHVNN